jgi:hypothetical protein
LVAAVLDQVNKKRKLRALARLQFETLPEGKSMQTVHVGTDSAERSTIARLNEHLDDCGYSVSGKHHEICLNIPSRTAPENLKTILPQPVCDEADSSETEGRRSALDW